jgi:hypothetical protein
VIAVAEGGRHTADLCRTNICRMGSAVPEPAGERMEIALAEATSSLWTVEDGADVVSYSML